MSRKFNTLVVLTVIYINIDVATVSKKLKNKQTNKAHQLVSESYIYRYRYIDIYYDYICSLARTYIKNSLLPKFLILG